MSITSSINSVNFLISIIFTLFLWRIIAIQAVNKIADMVLSHTTDTQRNYVMAKGTLASACSVLHLVLNGILHCEVDLIVFSSFS